MKQGSIDRRGFTIVELLIVVVVIAILAAITIVAYNGIQNRTKASATQTTAAQAAKRIQQFYIENYDTYPVDRAALNSLGLSDGNVSLQYSANNNANPRTFCLTATTQNISYFVNNSSNTTPTLGGCAGHSQNGRELVTNFATNPSLEVNATNWVTPFGAGAMSGARNNERAYSGDYAMKVSRNSANSDSRMVRYSILGHTTGTFNFSAWVYVADTAIGTITPSFEFCGAVGSSAATVGTGGVTGQWRRVTGSYTVTTAGNMCINFIGGQNQVGAIFIDGLMIQSGTNITSYADGNTQDWAWSDAQNNSSSFGPSL